MASLIGANQLAIDGVEIVRPNVKFRTGGTHSD